MEKRNIGLIGLSFKAGTDDIRESPLLFLATRLQDNGFNVLAYDPSLQNKKIDRINLVEEEELLAHSELLVMGHPGPDFAGIAKKAKQSVPIIDLVRFQNDFKLEEREFYRGICW